jgi:hypothetical protein
MGWLLKEGCMSLIRECEFRRSNYRKKCMLQR